MLHEQNAVIGTRQSFLAARVDAIANGFDELGGLEAAQRGESIS